MHVSAQIKTAPTQARNRSLLRRVGAAGFVFFLAKGLLWLVAPLVLYWFS